MIKIVGHRGAPSLELENTLASLKKAKELGASGVEIDVRLTKDKQVVVCHDGELGRISSHNVEISSLTYEQLTKIPLNNGEHIPLLEDALALVGSLPIYIELKEERMVRHVLAAIDKFPTCNATVISFKHAEIALLKSIRPSQPAYVSIRTKPLEIINIARAIGADGIFLNFWILNFLTYFRARHNKLNIVVYTVNYRFIAWFIHFLYPSVLICTDHPEYFAHTWHIPHKAKSS